MKHSRHAEDQRIKGLSAKERLIGLDVQTLNEQVDQKRADKADNDFEESEWAEQSKFVVRHMDALEVEQDRVRRELEAEARSFSLQNLSKEQRREYALSDPDGLKKSELTRTGDHDERLGIASVQIMSGEDLLQRERQKQQHKQQRSWIEQQIYEKQCQKAEEAREEAEYVDNVNHVVHLRKVIEHEEDRVRGDISRDIATFNFNCEGGKAAWETEKQRCLDAEARELEHWQQDPFLNEAPYQGGKSFKGSTRDERIDVRNFQSQQIREREEDAQMTTQKLAEEDQESEEARQYLLAVDLTRTNATRSYQQDVMKENLRLAEEQRLRKAAERAERMGACVNPLF